MLFYKERFMEVKIVLGTLWGDEGKGNTVQWLCKKALEEGKKPCVVRFSGGPQAGHTVVHSGITHVCSSFGSGVLLGVPTFYIYADENTFIDPLCIENERKVLEKKGILNPELYVARHVGLITPYDVADQQAWAKDNPNMTCGKGVMSAKLRGPINVHWFGAEAYRVPFVDYLNTVEALYLFENKEYDVSETVTKDWVEAAKKLSYLYNPKSIEDFDVVIFEGTQGLLLDSEHGFYPYTTSTKVGLNGVPEKFLEDAEVYLVTRTYLTRHGEMSPYDRQFFIARKRNLEIPEDKLETNTFNKFQGEFRVAPMDCLPVEVAVYRHHLDNYQRKYRMKFNLAVTHMDVLDLYPAMTTREVASAISMTLTGAGLKLSDVYGAYGPDSNFKLLRSYDN